MTDPDPAALLVDALCAYRLTRLLTTDSITAPLRYRLSELHPFLADLLSCDHCASVWAAAATAVLPRRVRHPLAVAGAVSVYRELRAPPPSAF